MTLTVLPKCSRRSRPAAATRSSSSSSWDRRTASASSSVAGFGSYRVEVTVGATVWRTSVFPASECFVLPVKKAVRRAEDLEVGDTVAVRLDVLLGE